MSRAAARLVPRAVAIAVRDCIGLPPRAILTYIRLRSARLLGVRRDDTGAQPATSLLFVCHGNIMRSPFAAELSRARLANLAHQIVVRSAGTSGVSDRPADPRAIAMAARHGISLEAHRSRGLTRELVDASDVICVMDHRNEAELIARFPDVASKTILLGGVDRGAGDAADIPDPFTLTGDAVERVYDRIVSAVNALVRRLDASGPR